MIHQVRVIFGDTDQMGVVYYANYLRYFEASRAEYLRQLGSSGKHLDELGVALPVVEAHCKYRSPAHYDDLLDIELTISEKRAASMRFSYHIRRDETLLAEGHTIHACINKEGRPCRFPSELAKLL